MKMTAKAKRLLTGLICSILLIGLDQITKQLAVTALKGGRDCILIPGIFRLTYVENYGAAFGTWNNSRYFLLAVTGILVIYIFFVYVGLLKKEGYALMRGICIAIFSGGLGNITDRLTRGCVVDFFYFEWIDFPVFNVADCYITCAVAILIIAMFTKYRDSDMEFLIPFKKGEKHEP